MDTSNAFKAKLLRLAGEIPDASSLQQAQYAYGRIVYLLGLQILESFPEAAIGPDPSSEVDHAASQVKAANVAAQAKSVAGAQPGILYVGSGPGFPIRIGHGGPFGIDGQKPGGYINTIIKIAGTALCLGQPCQNN